MLFYIKSLSICGFWSQRFLEQICGFQGMAVLSLEFFVLGCFFHFSTFSLSTITRCSGLILYISCLSQRIILFPKSLVCFVCLLLVGRLYQRPKCGHYFYYIYAYTFVATFFLFPTSIHGNFLLLIRTKKHLVLMSGKTVYVMYLGEP